MIPIIITDFLFFIPLAIFWFFVANDKEHFHNLPRFMKIEIYFYETIAVLFVFIILEIIKFNF